VLTRTPETLPEVPTLNRELLQVYSFCFIKINPFFQNHQCAKLLLELNVKRERLVLKVVYGGLSGKNLPLPPFLSAVTASHPTTIRWLAGDWRAI
jgi:hypothetical protein